MNSERRMQNIERRRKRGSAIILAVVLTTLLAIVAVMFLLSSRIDLVGTSAIADNENLNLAIDTVIAQISEVLVVDVAGIDPNGEYYDYPDANDAWLACLEPYLDTKGTPSPLDDTYNWRQISDIYGNLYPISQNMIARILPDYNNTPSFGVGTAADADGDGVGDSVWVQVPNMTSSKGKPIFAAIRVVDNGGMLNVNTGYKFNSLATTGSSLLDVNLMSLSWRPVDTPYDSGKESWLLNTRNPLGLATYENDVIWQYDNRDGNYTPFDISDELEVRNRFVLNHQYIQTRLENWTALLYSRNKNVNFTPFANRDDWFKTSCIDANLILPPDANYAYRHIATTYNLDRIIDPAGNKMYNVNDSNSATANGITAVYNAVRRFLDPNVVSSGTAAQIAANLIDYIDGPGYSSGDPRYDPNNNVTVVYDDANIPHFGFEQPCIYISEIAQNFIQPDANDPNIVYRSYAIELYKPYVEDIPPGPVNTDWSLTIYDTNSGTGVVFPIFWSGNRHFHVFYNDVYNLIDINLAEFEANSPSPLHGAVGVEPNVILKWPAVSGATSYNIYFGTSLSDVFNATPADANVFRGSVPSSTTTYDPPGLLIMNTVYFWRIDAVVATGTAKGRVWRFTVNLAPSSNPLVVFDSTNIIWLKRRVFDPRLEAYIDVIVDEVNVPVADINYSAWLKPIVADPNNPNVKSRTHSFQRDIFPHKPIRRLWDIAFGYINLPSIGSYNSFVGDLAQVQAHPANNILTNVGQFGEIFFNNTYSYGGVPLPLMPIIEDNMRINLALPAYQRVFNYPTVFDPVNYGNGVNETRIKGRVNINTAPWFVIAQLPWVTDGTPSYELAQAIVAYRDKLYLANGVDYSLGRGWGMVDPCGVFPPAIVREEPGFASIGELMNVTNNLLRPSLYKPRYDIRKYATDTFDLNSLPDLTPNDLAIDDFEERDAIFARISNLVTVRSDIFTAYILIRIPESVTPPPESKAIGGPQKRFIAIFDRSEVPQKPVKIIAVQQVPDPR